VSSDEPHTRSLQASFEAPAQARRQVRAACDGWPDTIVDVAMMLTSELVTNAVRHGRGDVGLRISRNGDRLRIEVSDASPDVPEPAPPAGTDEERGRGLHIVDALAADWGIYPHDPGLGKTVWFELHRAPA
jgi:anti-sigma regulatory factor (Ser/Thr protein kinase)